MSETGGSWSILIPTWNNLDFLRLCVASLRRHSSYRHELVLHINDGSDGTREFARQEGLRFSHSPDNVGVCRAVNAAAALASRPYLVYFNDDMVALPEWDLELARFAAEADLPDDAWLSATMIEGFGHNDCCLADGKRYDYGRTAAGFQEARLLADLPQLRTRRGNINGCTWPPTRLSRRLWERVGGFAKAYSPGIGSDPDLAKRCYDAGCRHFVGVGRSLVYHFGSKTTGRVQRNDGRATFQRQHRMSIEHFVHHVLKRGTPWSGPSAAPACPEAPAVPPESATTPVPPPPAAVKPLPQLPRAPANKAEFPPPVAMAKELAGTAVAVVAGVFREGRLVCEPAVETARRKGCQPCGEFAAERSRCRRCGCYLRLKWRLAKTVCPLGKW